MTIPNYDHEIEKKYHPENFTVEIRDDCKVCGGDLPTKRHRTYCSKECRNKFHNHKRRDYLKKWQQEKRGEFAEGKKKCLICDRWYIQVGTHVIQRHGYEKAKEYKEEFDLPLKSGVIPAWYKKLKGDIALENGTWKNTQNKNAKANRYTKDDPKAIKVTGWKGRRGSLGYKETL